MELGDGGGGAHAGHHVLALGVDEVLAEEGLLAGGGVAGEGHAGAGAIAGVAEDHGLDVDGGAPVVGDLVHAAVDIGAGVVPGTEHGLDGLHELDLGVLGELHALLGLIELLEALHQLLHVVGVQLHVLLDALLLLQVVDDLLKTLLGQLHHHVGEHLDEPAVGVVSETGVVGLGGKALHGHVVEAQVQDGVHHAGHGGPGAGADGDQQGVGGVAELLPGLLLQLGQVLHDLRLDLGGDGAAIVVVLGAGLGGDGEALGHGHTQVGHLGQVGALAAQQLPHAAVAFREFVDKLCHAVVPPYNHTKRSSSVARPNYTISMEKCNYPFRKFGWFLADILPGFHNKAGAGPQKSAAPSVRGRERAARRWGAARRTPGRGPFFLRFWGNALAFCPAIG